MYDSTWETHYDFTPESGDPKRIFDLVAERNRTATGPYLTEAEIYAHGSPHFSQFFVECDLNFVNCSAVPFRYGKLYLPEIDTICFSFANDRGLVVQQGVNEKNGLSMTVDLNSKFITKFDKPLSAGPKGRLFLYNPKHEPSLENSYILMPGVLNSNAYSIQKVRLKEGYGKSRCSPTSTRSTISCVGECTFVTSARQCCHSESLVNCVSHFLSPTEELSGTAADDLICILSMFDSFDTSNSSCAVDRLDCANPCEQTVYKGEIEHSAMIHPMDEAEWIQKYGEAGLRYSLLKLAVYQSTVEVVTFTQVVRVTVAQLIGQLGGNLGLWCGVSFMSGVELVELVFIALFGVILKNSCQKVREEFQSRSRLTVFTPQ
eukprot:c3111_g1_i2.p1 GENE.c3111_g1_i2~~c3111_g1_i2.p1  ORF type:complete len:375 (-),score=78.56 c3111_g1_i2:5-1129(-)